MIGMMEVADMNVCKINKGNDGSGFMSKHLLNKMMVALKRSGGSLTDLYISDTHKDDIKNWDDHTLLDPVTRQELKEAGEMGSIWSVTIHIVNSDDSFVYGVDLSEEGRLEEMAVIVGEINREDSCG